MKPIDVTFGSYAKYNEDSNENLNLKLLIMSEYRKTKTFLLKDILQIGQKKFLLLTKLKTQFPGHM